MKQLLLTLLLLTGIASAAAGDGISGNWRCQTISYQQYGNNYLIFIDNTHWQHKEDGSLHGEGKLEVRIYSKNNPQARLYFDYASDGSWRQAGDKILLETIKPRLVLSNKTEAQVRLAAENIASTSARTSSFWKTAKATTSPAAAAKPQKTAADHGGFFIRNARHLDRQKKPPSGGFFISVWMLTAPNRGRCGCLRCLQSPRQSRNCCRWRSCQSAPCRHAARRVPPQSRSRRRRNRAGRYCQG